MTCPLNALSLSIMEKKRFHLMAGQCALAASLLAATGLCPAQTVAPPLKQDPGMEAKASREPKPPEEDGLVIYAQTKSPSGNYMFASSDVTNMEVAGNDLHLLFPKTMGDVRPPIQLKEGFVEYPPRFVTKAAWNKTETLAAVSTGGRIWHQVYLFRVDSRALSVIKAPTISDILHRLLPGFVETTRLFVMEPVWVKADTLQLSISGTAKTGENSYDDYDFISVWRVNGDTATEEKTIPLPPKAESP